MGQDIAVIHVPERQRYELRIDGQVRGHVDARLSDDTVIMPHVEVDPEIRGQNLGALLVKRALDDVRGRGLKVLALCPFVSAVARRYPDLRVPSE